MEQVETIIVGAGVVGLAIARSLAQAGREVLVLEAADVIGSITSSRNSGVIHAAIYYAPGSLKAKDCLAGRDLLYAYLAERGLPHRRCGKLIVATGEAQLPRLFELKANAESCGVTDLRWLTPAEVRQMEPQVSCVAALHSPATGILDVHAYMLSLQGDMEAAGGVIALQSPLIRAEPAGDGFVVTVGGDPTMEIGCHTLINAAGLNAQAVARSIAGLDPTTIPPQMLAKGSYFSLNGPPPFQMLIYPLPEPGSSGLHATCDLGGRIRFGPDIEWVETLDYRVDPARVSLFETAIRRYWPALPDNGLQPDYSGIRPKLGKTSPHDSDFMIQTERKHRLPGLINLYGIESPGLTASLALAERVKGLLLF